LLKDSNFVVLTADETRLQLEAEIRRAWLRKGERTVVKTERSKEHQNYLGFLDQKTGQCQVFEIVKGRQEYIIPVLEQLVSQYPNQRVCLIWDNASCHKGKLLRAKLKKGDSLEKLHLIPLPPYAPETNPIEHVWEYAKEKIANRSESNFEKTKSVFWSVINSRRFDYQI
jgi:transposase